MEAGRRDRDDRLQHRLRRPKWNVTTSTGIPLGDATVTLRTTAKKTGVFKPVPNGSIVMSPSNRRNPDHTNALGDYGWDVLPGFYDITATHAGCTAKDGKTGDLQVPDRPTCSDWRRPRPFVPWASK
jgi:hypothetical protein